MAPQVEEAVQAYVDESHSKVVGDHSRCAGRRKRIPATGPDPDDDPAEVIGALIVEQIEDSQPHEGLLPRVEVISQHASTALANALDYHRIFLLPLWLAIGRASLGAQGPHAAQDDGDRLGRGVLFLWLLVWPATFNLEGKGTLEPTSKRDVFASVDGVVEEVLVDHGEFVKKGQVLARTAQLRPGSRGHRAAAANWLSTQRANQRRPFSGGKESEARRRLIEPPGNWPGCKKKRTATSDSSSAGEKEERSWSSAVPIDGQINTWHVRELLLHRPVKQGQVLMSVADPNGDWELEVHMPEDRIGYVALAQKRNASESAGRFAGRVHPGNQPGRSSTRVRSRKFTATPKSSPRKETRCMVRVAFDKSQLQADRHAARRHGDRQDRLRPRSDRLQVLP